MNLSEKVFIAAQTLYPNGTGYNGRPSSQTETSMDLSLEQISSCLVILLCCELLYSIAVEVTRAAVNMRQQTIAGCSVYRGKELLYYIVTCLWHVATNNAGSRT
jgi:hypothetical protein